MTKRRHRTETSNVHNPVTQEEDTRIVDPYGLQMTPCNLSDHQYRKKNKRMAQIKNCADNPNCLFGLGEYQKGIWQKGKIIRRFLGDDPRDLIRGPYPSLSPRTTGRLGPCGLRNLGATCYLNSMLQCLFMNLPFRHAVYEWEPNESGASAQHVSQMRALQRLFAAMQLGKKSVYDPTEFSLTLSLNNGMQQDALEFNKLLLAHLRKIFLHSRIPAHGALLDKLFQGELNYVTKCQHCKRQSSTPSTYNELSLNLKGHKTVEQCLDAYLAAEILDGDNKYFCDYCQSKQNAERFIELEYDKLPPVLTLQLLRFVYDAQAGRKKKVMDVIKCEPILNMSDALRRAGYARAFGPQNDVVYRLVGYLNHRGKSANVGHYTASVAYPCVQRAGFTPFDWFEFDDSVVNPMSQVLDTEGQNEHDGQTIRSRDAYMLLYTRLDNHSFTVNEALPNNKIQSELRELNTEFESEVEDYRHRAEGLENRIAERIGAYSLYFEQEHPYPEGNDSYYWVGTDWLRSWINGEEVSPEDLGTLSQASAGSMKSDEQDPDATESDSDTERAAKQEKLKGETGDEGITSIINGVEGSPVATIDEGACDQIPFTKPIDVSSFVCEHCKSTNSNGNTNYCFAPKSINKLKRISASLFNYLRQECGVATTSEGHSVVFVSPSFGCQECESVFRCKLLNDAKEVNAISHELELLKGIADIGESHTYLMSRAWMASYKAHVVHEKKVLLAKQRGSKKPYTRGANVLDIAQAEISEVWQHPLNEDLLCPHRNLVLDKKKYRAMRESTWLYFKDKFPEHFQFPNVTCDPCPTCEIDQAENDETVEIARKERDTVLSRGSLKHLFRKRDVAVSSSTFLLNLTGATSKGRKHRAFLVSREWLCAWRNYIRDVDQLKPSVLSANTLTCHHDNLVRPPALVQWLNSRRAMESSTIGIEFVTEEEMVHLGELYGNPEGVYFYVERPTLQSSLQWRKCTLASLLANGKYTDLTMGNWETEDAVCYTCEEAMKRRYEASLQNFTNSIINVQELAEDEAVPKSVADELLSNTQPRRRSKRIKTDAMGKSTLYIAANADDSVYLFKTKIYNESEYVPSRLRLYYHGSLLEDSKSIRSYGVKAGDVVYMRVSDDIPDEEAVVADQDYGREVGFADSVFLEPNEADMRRAVDVESRTSSMRSGWKCLTCTLFNMDSDSMCEACGAPKDCIVIDSE